MNRLRASFCLLFPLLLAFSASGAQSRGGFSSPRVISPTPRSSAPSRSSAWSAPTAKSWSAKPAAPAPKPAPVAQAPRPAPAAPRAPQPVAPKAPVAQSSWSSRSGAWSAKPAVKQVQLSAADRALAEKAKSSGTAFQTRGDAVRDFKQKNVNKYTSRYESEPARRPEYIPQQTIVNNHHYTVIYDRSYHGYGYYDGGRWCSYDPLADAIILADLMTRSSYYVPPPPVYVQPTYYVPPAYVPPAPTQSEQQAYQPAPQEATQPVVVDQSQPSGSRWGWIVAGALIFGLVVLIGFVVLVKNGE